MNSAIEASDSNAEIAMPRKRARMKRIVRPVRDELHPEQRLDAQHLQLASASTIAIMITRTIETAVNIEMRDAEAHGDGEAAHRARAEHEQQRGRDQRGEVGVDDRANRRA